MVKVKDKQLESTKQALSVLRTERVKDSRLRLKNLRRCEKLQRTLDKCGDLEQKKRDLITEATKISRESKLLGSKRILAKDLRQQKRRLKHHALRLKTPSKKMQQLKTTVKSLKAKVDKLKFTAMEAIER